jgi:hypothetical protein
MARGRRNLWCQVTLEARRSTNLEPTSTTARSIRGRTGRLLLNSWRNVQNRWRATVKRCQGKFTKTSIRLRDLSSRHASATAALEARQRPHCLDEALRLGHRLASILSVRPAEETGYSLISFRSRLSQHPHDGIIIARLVRQEYRVRPSFACRADIN